MTPHWTHSFGMRATASGYNKWFDDGNTDINGWFGANADELYLPGEPASGDITGKIDSNVLADIGTPDYQQSLTGGAGDPLGIGITVDSTDSFDAANNTVHNFDEEAFAILCVFNQADPVATLFRSILGKASTYSTKGYMLYHRSGDIKWHVEGTADNTVEISSAPTGLSYAFCFRTVTSDLVGLYVPFASESTTEDTAGSIANAFEFSIGSVEGVTGEECVIGPTILWSGAAAETVIAARSTVLPAWWSS